MLFSRDKEDDDDFVPNPNFPSNLASIFGSSSSDGNTSLTYTAPKQPKRQSKVTLGALPSSASASTLIVAKSVQVFKMINSLYQNQGRMGAAIFSINTEEGCVYQLLLYRDKQQQLCSARIFRDFIIHIQPKNYCSFYDKHNAIWAILFNSPHDMVEFTLQVALAKWKSGDTASPSMIQDLWNPFGEESKTSVAAVGDTVELTYTLNTVTHTGQGEDETHRVLVVVEDSGWKKTLVGVQPTTKKAVILQPFLLEELNPKEVEYSSAVVVKLTVTQVFKVQKSLTSVPNEELKNSMKELPNITQGSGDSHKTTKADLITRMARMGQALPFTKTAHIPSDSDETEEDHSRRERAVPKPRTRVQHSTALPPATLSQQWAATPYMVGSMFPAPQLQSPGDSQSQFNMFLSEVRTTNSELRMGITRLTDKVEYLQNKLEQTDKQPGVEVTPVLERLLESEQQLRLQLQLVMSAVQNNQPVSESRAPLTSSSTATVSCQRCADLALTQEKMKKLQEENEYLQTSSGAQKAALQNVRLADQDQLARIESLQKQLEEERARLTESTERIDSLKRESDGLAEDLQKANNSIMELRDRLQEKQSSIDKLEQSLRDSEATKIEEVRRNLQEVLDPKPVLSDHIKKILNTVYRMVKVQFEPQNRYDAAFIQSVFADTIKAVTVEYLVNGELLPRADKTTVSTSQSAPAVTSHQSESEEVGAQYMRKDQRVSVDVEAKLLAALSADVPSDTAQAASPESAFLQKNSGESIVEDNRTSSSHSGTEIRRSDPPSELNALVPDSADDSSDDVWRPQPPPPPLFDKEENDGNNWIHV